jgi:hypothetical protein
VERLVRQRMQEAQSLEDAMAQKLITDGVVTTKNRADEAINTAMGPVMAGSLGVHH